MSDTIETGWASLDPGSKTGTRAAPDQLEVAFARCFAGADGEAVLDHLRSVTLERALGPGSSDADLRHLDGQRCLVLHIQALIDRGRGLS